MVRQSAITVMMEMIVMMMMNDDDSDDDDIGDHSDAKNETHYKYKNDTIKGF